MIEASLSEIVGDIEQGMIPASVYSDDEIFELERERVFGKAWIFLAHESEVPEPGDYVLRRILDDSLARARILLARRREALDEITALLVERESIDAADLRAPPGCLLHRRRPLLEQLDESAAHGPSAKQSNAYRLAHRFNPTD